MFDILIELFYHVVFWNTPFLLIKNAKGSNFSYFHLPLKWKECKLLNLISKLKNGKKQPGDFIL